MTEQDWNVCSEPQRMFDLLPGIGVASDRKLRLFACADCRRFWSLLDQQCFRHAVEVAEQFADGQVGKQELAAARRASEGVLEHRGLRGERKKFPDSGNEPYSLAWSTTTTSAFAAAHYALGLRPPTADRRQQAAILRCIFGPFPVRPRHLRPAVNSSWLTPTVKSLAAAIYLERAFDRLPILADALEDAGCTNADILSHCRQPGEHCRGCWVVDLLLGKE